MIGVFVTFIRVVYRTLIYMSVPRWRFGITFCTYTISRPLAIAENCHLDWLPALSNTYRNLPFLPAASRKPGHTGSYHGADWLPAISNTYRNLPFLPAASRNPGHKTTVIHRCRDGE